MGRIINIYDEMLLHESKNGMKTYLDHIYISSRGQHHHSPHIEYSTRIKIGSLTHRSQIHIYIGPQEVKLDDIKKYLLKIKEFKICDKCGNCMNSNDECRCNYGEEKSKYTILLKKMLNMPIKTEQCPICLENIEDKFDAIFFTKCEKPHYFHIQCLSKIREASCPTCRTHCHRLMFRDNIFSFDCHLSTRIIIFQRMMKISKTDFNIKIYK